MTDSMKPYLSALEEADRYGHLPISVHTSVLDVDILGHPREEASVMDGYRSRSGLDADPEITTWVGGHRARLVRPEVAAWARRNLFHGARPGDDPDAAQAGGERE